MIVLPIPKLSTWYEKANKHNMIWIFGCSHSSESDWPKHLKLPVTNYATQAWSNDLSAYRMISEMMFQSKPETVIFQWSHITRHSRWIPEDNRFIPLAPWMKEYPMYSRNHQHLQEHLLKFLLQFELVRNVCVNNNLRLIQYTADGFINEKNIFELCLEHKIINHDYHQKNKNTNWLTGDIATSNRKSLATTLGLKDDETGHWDQDSCVKFAEYVSSII